MKAAMVSAAWSWCVMKILGAAAAVGADPRTGGCAAMVRRQRGGERQARATLARHPRGARLRAAGVRYASLRSFVLRAHCSTMAGGQEWPLRPVSNRQQKSVAQPHRAGIASG
ncbi:exported hypothetical protein [Cupriavidus taiwanensis]|nr:exported hypothetical protein [Cupriavidus taiwanensis]SOZ00035.1 exported hypothetical protein [Cupriavidus taiwanensis]